MQTWETEELHEHISQGVLLLSKLLLTPDDCELRSVCENWISEHKSYLPEPAKGFDISLLDGDTNNLNF